MGLDERSRAADSLSSVLAVYDGFCNLKQVRPSMPELTHTHTHTHKIVTPFFPPPVHFPRVVLRSVVQSSDLFSSIWLSKMLRE